MQRPSAWIAGVGLMAAAMSAPAAASIDPSAQALIERMQSAAASILFSGTFVHQQDSTLHTSRITQTSDGRQVVMRLQSLEGHRQETIRTPSETRIYIPDQQMIKLDQTAHRRPVFPSMFVASPALVLRNYDVSVVGSSRVADVDAQELLFKPKHDQRWPMRVWIDKRTSLAVKCQKLGADNRPIEQAAFTELSFPPKPTPAVMQDQASTKDWKVHDVTMLPVSGAALKYKPETLKGFELIGVYQRSAASGAAAPFESRRYVFSDGIALVSVFVHPKSAGGPLIEKPRRKGGQSMLSRESSDAWLTLIGDVPPEALKQFAQTIEWK
jgi:sigma-E factor negative regulatory protein RseB